MSNNLTTDRTKFVVVLRRASQTKAPSDLKLDGNRVTELKDIFISIKTASQNHVSRLQLLINTWVQQAKNQTYIFTDQRDEALENVMAGHIVNTNCSRDHNRRSLVCKMGHEFDMYIVSELRWWCHVDDDTYLNVKELVRLLAGYRHTEDWYLGKPSLDHPIEVINHVNPGPKLAFWFATGGAGFCVSRALALKMVPYAGGGRLTKAGDQIRLPDDCTIGYIINSLLHKELTVIDKFHSHLEALWRISPADIITQISLSYLMTKERTNIVNVPGFPVEKDPTRLWSIHCLIHPLSSECLRHVDR
ncbi:hypothetical protein DPMN_035595 [Dreissena polymorpha]|uniref:Fringe-like glycosyltransferase domain-containing protein n=3 Tax=Dreissena polymorpha TaxID=45954 RepID=A0A9D4MAW5_DREPO|nr:hypothetical protein DPMN_035595 [Dreissena polymorpha]